MSPVGHSLTGLALGLALGPTDTPKRRRAALLGACVLAANLPDLPLPCWGHDDYKVSHSMLVNVLMIGLSAIAVIAWRGRETPIRVVAALGLAWLSHLLLDSFYNHGAGVRIGWPINDYRLNLPAPWFNTLDLSQPIHGPHNLAVFMIEAIAYAPLVLLAWMWKTKKPWGAAPA